MRRTASAASTTRACWIRGIGHKFVDSETTKLSGRVGVGYKFWETLDTPRDKDGSIAGTAGVDFSHQFNASTSVFNKFGAEVTSGNNFLQNEAGPGGEDVRPPGAGSGLYRALQQRPASRRSGRPIR